MGKGRRPTGFTKALRLLRVRLGNTMAAAGGAAGEAVEYLAPAEINMMLRDNEELFMRQIKVRPLCNAGA